MSFTMTEPVSIRLSSLSVAVWRTILGAITNGNGRIGASFREFPADSITMVQNISNQLKSIGLGSLLCIGNPGQSLHGVFIAPQRVGAIIIGGLNPMSIFEETGLHIHSIALSGLIEFDQLFHYSELKERLTDLRASL